MNGAMAHKWRRFLSASADEDDRWPTTSVATLRARAEGLRDDLTDEFTGLIINSSSSVVAKIPKTMLDAAWP